MTPTSKAGAPSRPRPVFILGSGRSGTTITASLINRLPGVHIASETGYLSGSFARLDSLDDSASRRDLIRFTNSWLSAERWTNRATDEGFRQFASRYEISGAAAWVNYVWQLDCNVAWDSLSHIGDNTPGYVFAVPMIDRLLPDALYIHVVRDPRDVVCSVLKMKFGANDPVIAALDWHCCIGAWMMAERVIPADRRMELHYEDLCEDPGKVLARVSQFLGGTPEAAEIALQADSDNTNRGSNDFAKVAQLEHHRRLTEPISKKSVARFRTELTEAQVQAIEEIAQHGMLAYGYRPARWYDSPIMLERRLHFLKASLYELLRRTLRSLWRRRPGSGRSE